MTATSTIDFDMEAAKQVPKTALQLSFGERTWWYEWINLATVFFPFVLSFDRRVQFYKQWRYVLPAIFLTAAFFVVWDIYFTAIGIWGFNERYVGVMIAGLPLGEWLFFITVPYACLFIYACLEYYFSDWGLQRAERFITPLVLLILLGIGLSNLYRAYTAWTFLLSAALLAYHYFFVSNAGRGRFYQAYLVVLVPFLIVNGILTGACNEEPVVLYNNAHNLTSAFGSRLITIPWDDFAYCFLMLLINFSWMQLLRQRVVR